MKEKLSLLKASIYNYISFLALAFTMVVSLNLFFVKRYLLWQAHQRFLQATVSVDSEASTESAETELSPETYLNEMSEGRLQDLDSELVEGIELAAGSDFRSLRKLIEVF